MKMKRELLRLIKRYQQKIRREKQMLPFYLEIALPLYAEHLMYIEGLENYLQFLKDVKNRKEV